jgi:ribosomal protein S18 acetylase RimI-like enzyme
MAGTAIIHRKHSRGGGAASGPADRGVLKHIGAASSATSPASGPPAQRPAEFQVRLAISTDIPRLFELKLQSVRFSKEATVICATEDDWRRGDFGSSDRFAALVAEIDGRIVGMLGFHERYDTGLGNPTFYIEDIYVESANRRLGIGSSLLAELAVRALERNIPRIDLHVREDNSVARRLYRKLGFERLRGSIVSVLGGRALRGRAETVKHVPHRGTDASSTASMASRRGAEPMAFHVRFATPKDVARLFQLKCQMAILDGTIDAMRATADDWLRDCSGPRPRFAALLAEDDAAIIAMLTFSAHHYSALPEPALCIQDLFVQPDRRRRGIASALLTELFVHARRHQVCHVELNIRKRDSLGRTMSRRLGFARVHHCATYLLAGPSLLQLAEGAGDIAGLLI